MASKYKRHARGGRFKSPNIGDLGISALRERDQTIIDSLQLQRNQQAEIDQSQMTAIERSFDKERQNMQDLQSLEDKIYRNKREAIQVRNKRDIESIKGRADEYRRSAEHWEQLSPKLGQAFTALGAGYDNVTHKLGYKNALANQADNDTLKLWADKFEKGIDLADKQNLKDQEELKKEGATETQLLGLDSTSAFYKAGRVTYLTQDIIDNLDEHIDQGMRAYIDQFGTVPSTTEEQSTAYNWILGQIEEGVGISNYKYHKGVVKFREEFNKKTASRVNGQTRARVASTFTQKYNERIHTFNAGLKQTDPKDYFTKNQDKFDQLVEWTLARGINKEGKRKYNNKAEAAKAIFETWATDLTIPPEELFRRLDFKTPKDGRQPGDKETYAGRFPLLKQQIIEARSQAMQKKNTQYTNAEKYLSNQEVLNIRSQISSGEISQENPESITKAREKLKNLPHGKEALKHLDKVAHQNNVTASSVKDMFYSLKDEHPLAARRYLEHQSIITGEDKKKMMAQLQPFQELEAANLSWNTNVKGTLKQHLARGLGFEDKVDKNNIAEQKLGKAQNQFLAEYIHERALLSNNTEYKKNPNALTKKAYETAMNTVTEDINKGKETGLGEYGVIPKRGKRIKVDGEWVKINNNTGFPAYRDSLENKDDADQIDLDTGDINPETKWETYLEGKTKQKIVSSNQLSNWVSQIDSDSQVSSTDLIDSIAENLPEGHKFKGKPRAIIKDIMINGANATEKSKLAAEKITFDNKDNIVNLIDSQYVKLKKAAGKANSNDRLLLLLGWQQDKEEGRPIYDANRPSTIQWKGY